jgi:hypothetical protein
MDMDIEDLSEDERTALVGLLKAVVLADGTISDEEIGEVDQVVEALGEEEYQRHMDRFEAKFTDLASFQKFLGTIERQDARELIFGTILSGAAGDAIEKGESDLLTWLAGAWDIDVTVTE